MSELIRCPYSMKGGRLEEVPPPTPSASKFGARFGLAPAVRQLSLADLQEIGSRLMAAMPPAVRRLNIEQEGVGESDRAIVAHGETGGACPDFLGEYLLQRLQDATTCVVFGLDRYPEPDAACTDPRCRFAFYVQDPGAADILCPACGSRAYHKRDRERRLAPWTEGGTQ